MAGKPAKVRHASGQGGYDAAVHEALVVIWEVSDRLCGGRLRPLIPVLVEASTGMGASIPRRRSARAGWR